MREAPAARPASRPALAIVCLALLALVVFGRLPGPSMWASDLGNAAHGPAFAAVTLVVFALLSAVAVLSARPLLAAGIAVALAIALGATTELVQYALGRDATWGDLGRDALGAFAVGGFLVASRTVTRPQGGGAPLHRAALATGILCGLAVLAPFAVTGAAYAERALAFPVLVDFRSPQSGYFLRHWGRAEVARERIPAAPGRPRGDTALHVRIEPRKPWSVALWEPVADWRGYGALNLDLLNPTDEPLRLKVWIRDRSQGRDRKAGFRHPITIPPHARRIVPVPLAGLAAATGAARVDTAHIHSVILLRSKDNAAVEFHLLRLFLD